MAPPGSLGLCLSEPMDTTRRPLTIHTFHARWRVVRVFVLVASSV